MPEIEAKFLLQRSEQLEAVLSTLRELGYSVTKGTTEAILDRYFDTLDWRIRRAGWAYRCRQKGHQEKLTLKALQSGAGPVFVREEIEQPLEDTRRADGELPRGPVQERLEPIINGHARRELFSVRNRRLRYDVAAPDEDATTIEMAVDRAEIITHASRERPFSFTELELELREGDCRTVEALAEAMSERLGLVSAQLSKFERGLQVAGIDSPAEMAAPVLELTRDSSMLDLTYSHLRRHLQTLKLQHPRAWEGLDPEGVHQMRIAIRRLRAALRVFGTLLPRDRAMHFDGEFRWLARALGDVRDADVYDENFHKYLSALPEADARALTPYEAHLQRVKQKARSRLLEVLSGDRYERLVADLERFIAAGPSMGQQRRFGELTIGFSTDAFIQKAVANMVKNGRRIDDTSPDKRLHKLRIKGKRVRYLMEFFSDFYDDGLKKPLKASKRLQDVLGEHQDAVVACSRVRAYADGVSLKTDVRHELLALGRLVQSQAQHADKARARFANAWRRFETAVESL